MEQYGKEVTGMCLTEFDEEKFRQMMREEGIDEEEKVLQTCLKEGLYDSVYDGDNLIGIKLTLKNK